MPTIFFSHLSKLEELSLNTFASSNLREILATLPQLKNLAIVNATIRYDENYKLFGSSSKLEKLALYSNTQPSYAPVDLFDGLVSLKELTLSNYEYGTLSNTTLNKDIFSGLKKLEKLTLIVGSIQSIEPQLFSQNTELKELFLQAEDIKEIPAALFKTLTKLEILDIIGWWNVKDFPADLLASQKQLKKLSLYKILSKDTSGLSPDFLKGLTQLKEIDLRSNHLPTIPLELFESSPEDSNIVLGWEDKMPLEIQGALKAKYPKMTFTF